MNIVSTSYVALKEHYNSVLNKDKTTYKSTNDEPTPIDCVEEMINKLPEEVWNRDNLRILDPCCGNGNFHLVVHNILMQKGFNSKSIVEDILYFNDLNIDRIENVRKMFCATEFSLNIREHDFLKSEYDEKFDIIVANPPYAKIQKDGTRASKNHNLIKEFLEKSLQLLKPNGYLVFITPDNWMSYADRNTLINKLTGLQIHYLNIHTAKKHFKKIGSSFTWYVIENVTAYKHMVVEGIYKGYQYTSQVPNHARKYIPLFYNNLVHSILSKTIDNDLLVRFKVETSSDLHKYTKRDLISPQESDEFKYRLIHTPKQTVYAKRPHKYQEGYKVFLSTTDKYKVFVDDCGMTQSIAFIRCLNKEDAEQVIEILSHPLYQFINNICRWGNFNNIRILQRFPKPDDCQNIYHAFGITDEEKEFIITYM